MIDQKDTIQNHPNKPLSRTPTEAELCDIVNGYVLETTHQNVRKALRAAFVRLCTEHADSKAVQTVLDRMETFCPKENPRIFTLLEDVRKPKEEVSVEKPSFPQRIVRKIMPACCFSG